MVLLLAALLFVGANASIGASESLTAATATVLTQPDLPAQVDVDIDTDGGAWYASPVWLAIGGLAVLIVIVLLVLATRSGGTTVVKD
jgi:hypothetical protein